MENLQTVREIYEAFGRGDVPAILGRLHPDVAWEHNSVDHGIPWLVPRLGRDDVVHFFESLQQIEFHRFEPVSMLEGPGQVAALIHLEATVRATGIRVVDFETHVFTFDASGLVTHFRHFADTHQHLKAVRPDA